MTPISAQCVVRTKKATRGFVIAVPREGLQPHLACSNGSSLQSLPSQWRLHLSLLWWQQPSVLVTRCPRRPADEPKGLDFPSAGSRPCFNDSFLALRAVLSIGAPTLSGCLVCLHEEPLHVATLQTSLACLKRTFIKVRLIGLIGPPVLPQV